MNRTGKLAAAALPSAGQILAYAVSNKAVVAAGGMVLFFGGTQLYFGVCLSQLGKDMRTASGRIDDVNKRLDTMHTLLVDISRDVGLWAASLRKEAAQNPSDSAKP